ncbi:hypothetical protein Fcan01_20330 [Folsomia candida]|uniref:Uncharacterized protein n=1 Tax=Folsomia candida TaxID=158441 RepID=A0A226DJ50_FOLCA|nr:hypothetical protein Fcan01_20330 [Folsomia candida]
MLHEYLVPPESRELAASFFFAARILTFVPISETCRGAAYMICIAAIITHLGLGCIARIQSSCGILMRKRRTEVDQYLVKVTSCRICFSFGDVFMTPLVSTTMMIGLIACIVLNFATLKMYGIIPVALFPYFPSLLGVFYVVKSILLNMVIDVYEDGRVLYNKWVWVSARSWDKPYLTRKLRGIQIPRIYGGLMGFNFYECTADTKIAYYDVILNYTITALLSINL